MSGRRECFRVITKGFPEEVTLELRKEGGEGASHVQNGGRVFQAEKTACAKGLRWGHA